MEPRASRSTGGGARLQNPDSRLKRIRTNFSRLGIRTNKIGTLPRPPTPSQKALLLRAARAQGSAFLRDAAPRVRGGGAMVASIAGERGRSLDVGIGVRARGARRHHLRALHRARSRGRRGRSRLRPRDARGPAPVAPRRGRGGLLRARARASAAPPRGAPHRVRLPRHRRDARPRHLALVRRPAELHRRGRRGAPRARLPGGRARRAGRARPPARARQRRRGAPRRARRVHAARVQKRQAGPDAGGGPGGSAGRRDGGAAPAGVVAGGRRAPPHVRALEAHAATRARARRGHAGFRGGRRGER